MVLVHGWVEKLKSQPAGKEVPGDYVPYLCPSASLFDLLLTQDRTLKQISLPVVPSLALPASGTEWGHKTHIESEHKFQTIHISL